MNNAGVFISRLRAIRSEQGLSQTKLARQTGLTRQAVGSIEAGRYLPNTLVALRLARVLGCAVEDLFAERASITRPLTLASTTAVTAGARVSVTRIRNSLVGYPLTGASSLQDGLAVGQGLLGKDTSHRSRRATVRLLVSERQLDHSAMLLGCDPAFPLLSAHVQHRGDIQLQGHFASSQRALNAIGDGEAHIAGCHLLDLAKDECNITQATLALGRMGGLVVTFASWEQGLMVARGNPKHIRSVADLACRGVRLANRDAGSGSRHLLDGLLASAGIKADAINGYAHCSASHLEAARRIQAGIADVAVGLRAVADACGLGFKPLVLVRCDLVIPRDHLAHPAVVGVLETLSSRSLREDLAALPGYESSGTGAVVLDIPEAA
jgi:putative molybdopterin biosynthesis protein